MVAREKCFPAIGCPGINFPIQIHFPKAFRRRNRNLAPCKRKIMRYFLFLITGLGTCWMLPAQTSPYFQQETHYHIQVSLDDRSHTLKGELGLTYINHAPDELSFIWFHLWPNAYRDQTTAFARQQVRTADTEFYFARESELGYIDSLQFSVNGQAATLEYDPKNPDLAKLQLPVPIKSGGSIQIKTPFFVKLPNSFSRLGHVGQSYQITQWYPKPAVYDQDGWHPMPYLDQGEFYSEFGSFEVQITLPENYVVGATGTLETASEKEFLLRKAAETRTYLDTLPIRPNEGYVFEPVPPSAGRNKTIRYIAEGVHDFAWFADKRFKVQHDKVRLPNRREVETWTMFTATEEQLWRKSIDYVNRSLFFYSKLVGDYPYPQATAVQSALSAGGGMEYPMITVIDLAGNARNLDEVITHEIGHNWFYGILASNERDHPWMDEGLTSFYEQRYMQTFYPPARQLFVPDFLVDAEGIDLAELTYLLQSRRRRDQAPDSASDEFTSMNYWLGAYYKPAKAFWWLYHYWGEEKFDRAMQDFFRSWQFRHPQPQDLKDALEKYTSKGLDWLFEGLLYSNQQLDYALKGLDKEEDRYRIKLHNLGDFAAPIPVAGLKNGVVVREIWVEGFTGTKEIAFLPGDYDQFVIDPYHLTLEVNRKNNQIKVKGVFPKLAPFRLAPAAKIENENHTRLFALPTLGWNTYDGLQLGLLLHNRTLPYKQIEFDLLPTYGFKSTSINGIGNLDFNTYPKQGLFSEIRLGVNYRAFHFQETGNYDLRYQRWQPTLRFGLRRPLSSTFSHQLQYRFIALSREAPRDQTDNKPVELIQNWFNIHEWSYSGINKRSINPFQYNFALEQQSYTDVFGRSQNYLKWSLDWESQFHYADEKTISARLFMGGFFENTRRNAGAIFPGAFSLIDQATMDYRYDDFYFGRSEREGFLSQQLTQRDGGFKTPVSPAFNLGKSNNFILSLNLMADLPFGHALPLRPYLDLGYFDNAMPTGGDAGFSDQFLWSGGLAIEVLDGRLGLYFPLVNSKNIQDRLIEQGNYWKRISFRFDLYGKKLRELLENSW